MSGTARTALDADAARVCSGKTLRGGITLIVELHATPSIFPLWPWRTVSCANKDELTSGGSTWSFYLAVVFAVLFCVVWTITLNGWRVA